jgi:hypothetical protein
VPAAGCFVVGTAFVVLLFGTFFTGVAGVEEAAPLPLLGCPDAFFDAGIVPDCCAKEIPANKTNAAVITLNFFMTNKIKIG